MHDAKAAGGGAIRGFSQFFFGRSWSGSVRAVWGRCTPLGPPGDPRKGASKPPRRRARAIEGGRPLALFGALKCAIDARLAYVESSCGQPLRSATLRRVVAPATD